jgi:hypothetical protein
VRGMYRRLPRALFDGEGFFFVQEMLPRVHQMVVKFVSLGHFGFPPCLRRSRVPPPAMVKLLTDFQKNGESGERPHAQAEIFRRWAQPLANTAYLSKLAFSLSNAFFEELSMTKPGEPPRRRRCKSFGIDLFVVSHVKPRASDSSRATRINPLPLLFVGKKAMLPTSYLVGRLDKSGGSNRYSMRTKGFSRPRTRSGTAEALQAGRIRDVDDDGGGDVGRTDTAIIVCGCSLFQARAKDYQGGFGARLRFPSSTAFGCVHTLILFPPPPPSLSTPARCAASHALGRGSGGRKKGKLRPYQR